MFICVSLLVAKIKYLVVIMYVFISLSSFPSHYKELYLREPTFCRYLYAVSNVIYSVYRIWLYVCVYNKDVYLTYTRRAGRFRVYAYIEIL